jgi:hypothetical protein
MVVPAIAVRTRFAHTFGERPVVPGGHQVDRDAHQGPDDHGAAL